MVIFTWTGLTRGADDSSCPYSRWPPSSYSRWHRARGAALAREPAASVLMNAKKHGVRLAGPDRFSSARWFDGFAEVAPDVDRRPTASGETWLARSGWRRRGLIRLDEQPG